MSRICGDSWIPWQLNESRATRLSQQQHHGNLFNATLTSDWGVKLNIQTISFNGKLFMTKTNEVVPEGGVSVELRTSTRALSKPWERHMSRDAVIRFSCGAHTHTHTHTHTHKHTHMRPVAKSELRHHPSGYFCEPPKRHRQCVLLARSAETSDPPGNPQSN